MTALSLPDTLVADITNGRVNLFLGAGASHGSTRAGGEPVPQSDALISLIAENFGKVFDKDDRLPDITGFLNTIGLGDSLSTFLRSTYLNCEPSPSIVRITSHFWPKIYTTNVDDTVTRAFSRTSTRLRTFIMRDPIVDFNLPERLTYLIHLHGSAAAIEQGIIFSRHDYVNAQINITPWYDQLSNDFFLGKFIFCGTKLDEPVFDYILEKKKPSFPSEEIHGYLVTPNLSAAKAAVLEANGILHVPGTVEQLADWLDMQFPRPLRADDVLEARYPDLFQMSRKNQGDITQILGRLKDVTVVGELRHTAATYSPLTVRSFYRGAKPSWDDLLDGVPAQLGHYSALQQNVDTLISGKNRALIVLGPAGSGKTTAIKTAALAFSKRPDLTVLSLDTSFPDFELTIQAISQVIRKNALVCFDGVDSVSGDLARIIDNRLYENVKFLLSERRNIWNERTSSQIGAGYTIFPIDRISKSDAALIREKLEMYGPFSKLARLKQDEQVSRIYDRSERQLLIGMLEATSEKGFENIIRSDFAAVEKEELRFLVTLTALATFHRMGLPAHLAHAAFGSRFGSYPKAHHFNSLAGIVILSKNELIARHPLYSQVLLEQIANPLEVTEALEHLLIAFAKYGTPIPVKSRELAPLFIRLARHRFVNAVLHGKRDAVIGLYERIEKAFSADGHFYLQFGLAHRAFGEHDEAMAKIETSVRIYNSFNARHAQAKQKIIFACQMNSRVLAEPLFEEAKTELELLDRTDRGIGMYPLVTLAEGEIDFTSVFFGREQAALVADSYSTKIANRLSQDPGNERLKRCRDKINYFKREGVISLFESDDVV